MSSKNVIFSLRDALKLASETSPGEKVEGLSRLRRILSQADPQLVEYGYDKVVLKELLKSAKFEEGEYLQEILDLIERYYADHKECQDDVMENLLHRYGLSTNHDVSLMCLKTISSMVDHMDDNIAKHSKQLLQLADITLPSSLDNKVEEILLKIEPKLPKRKLN